MLNNFWNIMKYNFIFDIAATVLGKLGLKQQHNSLFVKF